MWESETCFYICMDVSLLHHLSPNRARSRSQHWAFEASMYYIVRPYLQNKNKTIKTQKQKPDRKSIRSGLDVHVQIHMCICPVPVLQQLSCEFPTTLFFLSFLISTILFGRSTCASKLLLSDAI